MFILVGVADSVTTLPSSRPPTRAVAYLETPARADRGAQRADCCAEPRASAQGQSLPRRTVMPKFVIEREIPGAGKLSAAELQGISAHSCGVLKNLGPSIQWVQSYVTDDKVYCVYIAPNEELVREHARQGGFPANRVSEVREVIDPTTAETA